MTKFDLSNLKLDTTMQEEPVEIESKETVSSDSGSLNFSETLESTWNDISKQSENLSMQDVSQLPSFDLNIDNTEDIDELKVEKFIKYSQSIWKTLPEIQEAYKKWVEQWTFSKMSSEPTKEDLMFEKSLSNVESKDPGFLQRLSSLWSSFFREWWEQERKDFKESSKAWEIITWITEKTLDSWKWGIERIQEAWEWIATWKFNVAEWLVRGAAWALQSFLSPVAWVVWEWIDQTTQQLSDDFKQKVIEWVTPTVENITQWYNSQPPEQQRHLNNIGVWLEVLLELATGWTVPKIGKQISRKAWDITEWVTDAAKKIEQQAKQGLEKWREVISEWLQSNAAKLDAAASQQNREIAEKIALPDVWEMTVRQREKVFDKTTPILDNKWQPTWKFEVVREPREISAIEETRRLLDEGKITEWTPTVAKKTVVDNEIADLSNKIDADLRTSNVSLSKDDMKSVIDDLSLSILDNPSIVWSNENAVKKAILQFENLLKKDKYFPEDILQLRKDFDRIIKDAKWDKVFDPGLENAFTTSTREFRQGLNNKVADLAPESNLKEILRRQSALYDLNDTLKTRFGKETETFVKRILNKIQNVSGIPKTEIVELLALLGVSWIGWAIAAPLAAWGAAFALWREGVKMLTRPSVKKFRAKIFRKLDDAIKKNPDKSDNIKEVKNELKDLLNK